MVPSLYEILVFIHVLAGLLLVGSSASAPLIRSAIRGARTPGAVGEWVGFAQRATRLNPPAAMILLATGIWLGSQGWWSAGWFYVSVAAWVMNLLLAVLVVHRAEGKLAKAAREEAPMTAIDAIRHAPSWDLAIAAMLAADLALLWIMIVKPSTAASIGVMVGTLVIFVSIALARRGASLPAPSAAPVSD